MSSTPTPQTSISNVSFTLLESGFKPVDYGVFFFLMVISCVGGFWVSRSAKVDQTADYLLGNREMKTFPIAISFIASCITGGTIVETVSEIYNYGTQLCMILVGIVFGTIIVAKIYMPIFHNLNVSSSFRYLEIRFNRNLRAIAAVMFLIQEIFFLPIVMYVPASALNQYTGSDIYLCAAFAMLICGLYTALGGLRAVVWTNMAQAGLMFLGMTVVAVQATNTAGGWKKVIKVAKEQRRFILNNWDFSPCVRQTGWGSAIGGMVYWTCFASVDQTMVQRYMALPNQHKVIRALGIFAFGCMVIMCLCIWCGMAALAVWASTGCKPSGAPLVGNELLPAFVSYIDKEMKMDGLSGLFLAALYAAGLSSQSANLNSCALVVVKDIMKGLLKRRLKKSTAGLLARGVTLFIAVISILLCTITAELEAVIGIATMITNIVSSTTCGIFTLGILCYWVGPNGALAGAIAGALVTGFVSLGMSIVNYGGWKYPVPPIQGYCAKNATKKDAANRTRINNEEIFGLFRISHHWVVPIGVLTTVLVGTIVGYYKDKRIPRELEVYSPVIWRCFPMNNQNIIWPNIIMLLPPREEKRRSIFLNPSRQGSDSLHRSGSDVDDEISK